ncbi:hypothetical protein IKQ21_09180 [bacterium]|nr:hypothetical protein [bacterium]
MDMRIQPTLHYNIHPATPESVELRTVGNLSYKSKNKNHTTLTSTATLAIASVAAVMIFSKGIQKSSGKYLYNAKEFLEKKLENSHLSDNSKRKQAFEIFVRKFNSFLKKSESINNVISVKDILFMKFMFSTKPTEKIHKSITKYFEDLSRKTISDSYKKVDNNFKKMYEAFDKLDEYILKNSPDETIQYEGKNYTKKQLIEMAKGYRELAKVSVDAFISKDAQNARYEHIKSVTSSLYEKFWDASFKDFWSKNNKFKRKEMWQTFIAAEQIKGDKAELAEKIDIARNLITYSSSDKIKYIVNYIKELEGLLAPEDSKGFKIIEKLKWFVHNPQILKMNKDSFLQELTKLENSKAINTLDQNIIQTQQKNIKVYADLIKNILNDNSKGVLEDMLDIYYKLSPFELSKVGASGALKKAVSSFDKAVTLESAEFFDKERDLVLGSAPTDVLTILFSGCAISYGLGFAKDKDKRTSVLLKSGIPIIGAIATTMISATKLVSGTKSILLGLVSGLALNSIGTLADNLIKQNKNG